MVSMLQPNPARRLSLSQVLAHPWVARDMPPHLATLNDRLLQVLILSPHPDPAPDPNTASSGGWCRAAGMPVVAHDVPRQPHMPLCGQRASRHRSSALMSATAYKCNLSSVGPMSILLRPPFTALHSGHGHPLFLG